MGGGKGLVWDRLLWWGSWSFLTWQPGNPSSRISRVRLTHYSSFREPFHQALTLLGGVRIIAWCMRRLFLKECQWRPKHFCDRQAYLGYGSTPGPSKISPLCHTCSFGGAYDKYLKMCTVQLPSRCDAVRTTNAPVRPQPTEHVFFFFFCTSQSTWIVILLACKRQKRRKKKEEFKRKRNEK